jgi:hypothetical protein
MKPLEQILGVLGPKHKRGAQEKDEMRGRLVKEIRGCGERFSRDEIATFPLLEVRL